MADDGFNGATFTFASVAIGPLRSISTNSVGAEVPVTGSGDSEQAFAAGIPKKQTTVIIVGGTTLSAGDAGVSAVAWSDIGSSTDGSETTAQVVSVDTSGSMDSEILSTIVLNKAAPVA